MTMPETQDINHTAYNYCALPLASYACRPDMSAGRYHDEPESRHRTCFQRDRDRVIHCGAFRRLKYKTQVFVYHEGDHYRTRLTHTLEVAQIARTLARALLVNEDLAELVALAHDLGHTPFAHVGEDILKDCMKNVDGFDHNDQSLRVVTVLENKYAAWRGLNLSWESLEGIVKHNGPLIKKGSDWRKAGLPVTAQMVQEQLSEKGLDLRLDSYASLEAQIAALADDIAYNNHDVEDGLRAGLFTLDDIQDVELLAELTTKLRARYPDITDSILIYELVRSMIGAMVEDVLAETRARLKELGPESADDIRSADRPMVEFSAQMLPKVNELRDFLKRRMYNHYQVNRMRLKVGQIVEDLYYVFTEQPQLLPDNWQDKLARAGGAEDEIVLARVVADYIAGMTDRYAMREHERLFSLYKQPS